MKQHESDQAEVIEATERWMNSESASVCVSSIIMHNLMLNAADVLRQCPAGDPTGEQLAAFEETAKGHLELARHMCGGNPDPHGRYSSKAELLALMRSTRLDRGDRSYTRGNSGNYRTWDTPSESGKTYQGQGYARPDRGGEAVE